MEDIRIISIKQPWASLIVAGLKPVENRSRKSNYRGKLFIHASLKFDESAMDFIYRNFLSIHFKLAERSRQVVGGIIGHVMMTDCVTEYDYKWFFGPYGYVFESQTRIEFIPCKGQLGIFRPKGELLKCLASK